MTPKEIDILLDLVIQLEPEDFICEAMHEKSDWCQQNCDYPFMKRKCVAEYARRKANDEL